MASETTFDHWKVFFSLGKVRKRALTFEVPCSRFQDLHILSRFAISENLAFKKMMGIFFRFDGSSGPMWAVFRDNFWTTLALPWDYSGTTWGLFVVYCWHLIKHFSTL